jgi:gliding motility-associated-like protein
VVTAQDGATTKSYIITATRAAQVQGLALAAENPDSLKATADGVIVHPGVSPNGDGISDYLVIDGLNAYPGNKLTIMDRSGVTVFAANNYGSKVFDGHSSINGSMQLPGTYFYLLEYNNGKENKRKTGFILLKY